MRTPATEFIDSNILLYLLSADTDKANRAEAVVRAGGTISVQVLNEITNVMRRKLSLSWMEINEVLALIRSICPVEPLTIEMHDRGRLVAERYGLNVYDAMIVAAALIAECKILYSEDMQDGLLIDNQLHIRNPLYDQEFQAQGIEAPVRTRSNPGHASQAQKILDVLAALDAAEEPGDVGLFPGWRLHSLIP